MTRIKRQIKFYVEIYFAFTLNKTIIQTFLGGGGGLRFGNFGSPSCKLSLNPFFDSLSGITTKKWLQFSHFTNLDAAIRSQIQGCYFLFINMKTHDITHLL